MQRKTSCSDGTERPYERAPAAGSAVSSSSKSGAKAAAASVGSATATSSGCSCSTLASGTCRWTSARSCAVVGGPPGGRATVRCCARPYRRFREREVPTARSRPLCITAIRSPRASASSRKCVVITIVRPALAAAMAPHTVRREAGSIPAVGSSSNTSFGSPISAQARESLRFWPPDRLSVRTACRLASRPTLSSIASRRPSASWAGESPLTAPASCRFSSALRAAKVRSCCGQTPERRRMASMPLPRTEWPYTVASPDDCGKRPVRMPIVVVLPAPFCPSSAVICPSYRERERASRATTGFGLAAKARERRSRRTASLAPSGGGPLSSTAGPSVCAARSGICLTHAGPAERRRVAHQSQHTAEASWKAHVTSREGPLPEEVSSAQVSPSPAASSS
mmetsp:Transcript_44792/g.149594  ORF Transcript_44792/g.149594 Transcript_44792/m.149594 type:complete len:396 (+) Transcript_44792:2945-4132(+)